MATDTTMSAPGAASSSWGDLSRGEIWLLVGIGYFLLLRIILAAFAFPLSDEAYYWMWGRNLQLSYYDHPPLGAWVQGVFHAIFGTNNFALRLPTFLSLAAVIAIFYDVAQRVGGDAWRPMFLKSTLVFLAAPIFGVLGAVAMHDYLMIALLMGSGYFFTRYFLDVEEGRPPRLWHLLGAAVLLGFAGLTKYIAVFLGLAVIGAILVRPQLRQLLLRWEIYAAGLLTVALQAPSLIWNLQHDFASLSYQLVSRHQGARFHGIDVERMGRFAAESLALTSPVLLVPIAIRFFLARQAERFERIGKTLALWLFWPPALIFLFVANYSLVLFWWVAILFVLVMPFSGRHVGRIALGIHVFWGGVVSTFLAISLAIVPILGAGGMLAIETDHQYGWDKVRDAVRAAETEYGTSMVATNLYRTAAQLAFAIDDADVVAIAPQVDAFDFWFDPAAHRGEDAIVVVAPMGDRASWKKQFATVEKLEDVQFESWGIKLAVYEVWHATGFRPLDGAGTAP